MSAEEAAGRVRRLPDTEPEHPASSPNSDDDLRVQLAFEARWRETQRTIPHDLIKLREYRKKVIEDIQLIVGRAIDSPSVDPRQKAAIADAIKSTAAQDVAGLGRVHENTLSTRALAVLREKILLAEQLGRGATLDRILTRRPNTKLKILAVISAVWVIVALSAASRLGTYGTFHFGQFLQQFCLTGILPVVVAWGSVWIFRKEES